MDVGTHNGLYARRASLYFPLKRTIMVEPIPEEAAKLRQMRLPGGEVVQEDLAEAKGRARVRRLSSGLRLGSRGRCRSYGLLPAPHYSMFV